MVTHVTSTVRRRSDAAHDFFSKCAPQAKKNSPCVRELFVEARPQARKFCSNWRRRQRKIGFESSQQVT